MKINQREYRVSPLPAQVPGQLPAVELSVWQFGVKVACEVFCDAEAEQFVGEMLSAIKQARGKK